MHLAAQCPHKNDHEAFTTEETSEQEALLTTNITLITSNDSDLLAKNIGFGILDSACTKTVAGQPWIEEYLQTMTQAEKTEAQNSKSTTKSIFRFGDGVETASLYKINIPVRIGSKIMKLQVDVVNNNIPLLISKPTMQKMKMTLDFEHNTATVSGETIRLNTTESGHFCIPLTVMVREECNFNFNMDSQSHRELYRRKEK